MTYIVNIRPRRQITIPQEVLNQLLVSQGDKLSLEVVNKKIIVKPVKEQAIDSLKAIQKAFQKTKISEAELQESGEKIRKNLADKLYGAKD